MAIQDRQLDSDNMSMSEHEEQADKLDSPGCEDSMYQASSFSRARLVFFILGAVFVLTVSGVSLKIAYEGGSDVIDGAEEVQKPPPTAAEIIANEFAGKIETAKVDPETLAEPPPGFIPSASDTESRELEDEFDKKGDEVEEDAAGKTAAKEPAKGGKTAGKAGKSSKQAADKGDSGKGAKPGDEIAAKGKKGRKLASIDKTVLTLDKAGIKVSKNLDKKKVTELLSKKLDTCHPKVPEKTKSLKAEIKLSKTGGISNIKVTPSSAEKELAKCMRAKLGDAKALKPKDKSVAQVTVQFKIK